MIKNITIREEIELAIDKQNSPYLYRLVGTCMAHGVKYDTIYGWVASRLSMDKFNNILRQGGLEK
jgi:hypothetical protein